jgi:hypothetical protein
MHPWGTTPPWGEILPLGAKLRMGLAVLVYRAGLRRLELRRVAVSAQTFR